MNNKSNHQPKQKQLYYLFKHLSSCVENRDELATIVSYTVLEGLYDFNTNSNSAEEIKFEEMKNIYKYLDLTIDHLVEKLKIFGQEDVGYDILCDKLKSVDPLLRDDVEKKRENGRPELLTKIVETLPERGYQDKIRRRGLVLLDTVEQRGELRGNRDRLIGDYQNLLQCLTEGEYR